MPEVKREVGVWHVLGYRQTISVILGVRPQAALGGVAMCVEAVHVVDGRV